MAEDRVIIVDPQAQAKKQFADEMREYRKKPLDRAKKPGGYYLNADGSGAHDANGNPVDVLAADKEAADELKRQARARYEQEPTEAAALDSPEEVADRGSSTEAGPLQTSGGVWVPAAVEEGQVGPDGTASQPRKQGKKGK